MLDRLDCGKRAPLEKPINKSIRSITKHKRQININIGDSKSENLGPRIVGGTESKIGEWPWQVSLLLNDVQYGGGAILSKDFVLTSAHLFTSENNFASVICTPNQHATVEFSNKDNRTLP